MPTFRFKYLSFSLGAISALSTLLFYWISRYSYFNLPDIHNHIIVVSVAVAFLVGVLIGKVISKFQQLATVDSLTQLWNKRCFNIRLQEELGRSRRMGSPLCIALIDIDNFKQINDEYGHSSGDSTLIHIANILRRHTRNIDVVTRWGGDEFAIIFPDTRLERGITIANRLRETVARSTKCCQATISVGLVMVDEKWDKNQVLMVADQMLYRAKQVKNLVVAHQIG